MTQDEKIQKAYDELGDYSEKSRDANELSNVERRMLLQKVIAESKLVEFTNKYMCPHDYIVVSEGNVQLLEGAFGFPTEIVD